jgi:hypothetical protein
VFASGLLQRALQLRANEENTQRTPIEHIENTDSTRFIVYKPSALTTFSIRVSSRDKRLLKEYFDRRSIPLSQGIRSVLVSFLEEHDLR